MIFRLFVQKGYLVGSETIGPKNIVLNKYGNVKYDRYLID